MASLLVLIIISIMFIGCRILHTVNITVLHYEIERIITTCLK